MSSHLSPAAVMQATGLHACPSGLLHDWEASAKSFSLTPFFLRDAYVKEASSKCGIAPSEQQHLLRVAHAILDSAPCVRLMWHQHHLLFAASSLRETGAEVLPEHVRMPGYPHTYNLLLALSGLPKAESVLGPFPREVLNGVYHDIGIWCAHFRRNLDVCGLTSRILMWEHGLMHGAFYRIGRLQFNIRPFHPNYDVYRHPASGAIRTLVRDGVTVDSQGRLDGVDGQHDEQAWVTSFDSDEDRITGYLLSPLGHVTRKRVALPRSEWRQVLAPSAPILDVHVPAGEPLDWGRCSDSFRQAVRFFGTYFPDKPFHGFSCRAWFLDTQFEQMLPPTSNILQFQHALHLYPVREGGAEGLVRIFGERGLQRGLSGAPRESSLQRAVATFLEGGGRLRAGGGFLLLDDLPFGRPVCRQTGCHA